MHTALLVALVGLVASTIRSIKAIATLNGGGELPHNGAGLYINLANAVCCAAFIALGIRSFINARRRRLNQPVA